MHRERSKTLKPETITPLYQQLIDKLKDQTGDEYYQSGDQLPSKADMTEQSNVSVIAARKTVDELATLDLVEKEQGKDTFVAVPKY